MKIIAITGGIGCGKSVVLEMLKTLNFPVYSADNTYKSMTENPEFIYKISEKFNIEPIIKDGKVYLDRKALSEKVFNDRELLKQLNAFTHPLIMAEMLKEAHKQTSEFVFLEVPLLFEGGFEDLFDGIIVVERDINERIKSVSIRDNLTEEEVKLRISNQYNYADLKIERHIFILHNDGTRQNLSENLNETLKKMRTYYNC